MLPTHAVIVSDSSNEIQTETTLTDWIPMKKEIHIHRKNIQNLFKFPTRRSPYNERSRPKQRHRFRGTLCRIQVIPLRSCVSHPVWRSCVSYPFCGTACHAPFPKAACHALFAELPVMLFSRNCVFSSTNDVKELHFIQFFCNCSSRRFMELPILPISGNCVSHLRNASMSGTARGDKVGSTSHPNLK